MRRVARQLGRYHVLDRIAFGGMAEIFRALTFADDGTSRIVAIKQVLPHYAEDREFIDMLVDEAKLVSMLAHQNIVETFEVSFVDGIYFVAMEWVNGKDLRHVVERAKALGMKIPFEVSAHILSEALSGLDTAHRLLDPSGRPAGLVHRDFSPSNVLMSYEGHVKICDFGIAKANFSRIQTKTGVIKGKVKYMSPEQAFGRKLDHRSDVFSAGSVLYEMLTGEPPFTANNEIDLIFMVRDARITPPRQQDRSVPEVLEQAVFRSMTRARGSRYQSAAEFRQSLVSYLRARGAGDWRAELSRFMKALYGDAMSKERAILGSYEVDVDVDGGGGTDLGRNLIADVLDSDAPWTKFNPFPTRAQTAPPEMAVHDANTRILSIGNTEELKTQVRGSIDEEQPLDQQATAAIQAPSERDRTSSWEGAQAQAPSPPQPPRVPSPFQSLAEPPPRAPAPVGASQALPPLFTQEQTDQTTMQGDRARDSELPPLFGGDDEPTRLAPPREGPSPPPPIPAAPPVPRSLPPRAPSGPPVVEEQTGVASPGRQPAQEALKRASSSVAPPPRVETIEEPTNVGDNPPRPLAPPEALDFEDEETRVASSGSIDETLSSK